MGGSGSLGTLFVRLTASSTDLVRGMNQAVSSVDKSSAVMVKRVVGLGVSISAALAAIGVVAVRQFSQFEDSFAGVRKTVEATEETFDKLSASFRQMAKEMPTNVNEINRVVEAAGALGIQTSAIEAFTKTMIDMGNTTNLSSEQAATEMARFANITGMAQDQFDNFGSTLVDLGNKLAATESEILSMGLRLAGAGKQVGMAESDILALAGALSSVGIEAEMGGTAMSQVMIRMSKAVKQGSDELYVFAHSAGLSAADFKAAFEKDASGALLTFFAGLSKLQDQGADVFTLLEEMGVDGARLTDVITRAAGAQKLFNSALRVGKEAWRDNNALTEEAAKRNATLSSQLTILWNNINDALIVVGKHLAGPVKTLTAIFQDLTEDTSKLDDQMKSFVDETGPIVISGIGKIADAIQVLNKGLKLTQIGFAEIRRGGLSWMNKVQKTLANDDKLVNALTAGYLGSEGVDIYGPGMQELINSKNASTEIADQAKAMQKERDRLVAEFKTLQNEPKYSETIKKALDQAGDGLERVRLKADEAIAPIKDIQETILDLDSSTAFMDAENAAKIQQEKDLKNRRDSLMAAFNEMPDARAISGGALHSPFSDPLLNELSLIDREMEEAQKDLDILKTISEEKIVLKEHEEARLLEIEQAYNAKLKRLRQAERELAVISAQSMFGDLASIAEAFAGRQSGIYKAMFAASKAFAIAEATIKISQAIAGAAASGATWIDKLAAMASIAAATSSIVSNIQSVKLEFGGKREFGGRVNPNQAFMVGERGPEMFIPDGTGGIIPNDELSGSRARGSAKVIINNYTDATPQVTQREEGGEQIIEVTVRRAKSELVNEMAEGRGDISRVMERTFGLRRGGK